MFNSNHFEQNTAYFDLTECAYVANMSICDNFFGETRTMPLITLPASLSAGTKTASLTVERNTIADTTAHVYLFELPESPVMGNYTGVTTKDNRGTFLTYENTLNAYLPQDPRMSNSMEFGGSTFAAFALSCIRSVAASQKVGTTELYYCLRTGVSSYTMVLYRVSGRVYFVEFHNANGMFTGRYDLTADTLSLTQMQVVGASVKIGETTLNEAQLQSLLALITT